MDKDKKVVPLASRMPPPSMVEEEPTAADDYHHLLRRINQVRGQLDVSRERVGKTLHLASVSPAGFQIAEHLITAIEQNVEVLNNVTLELTAKL